MSRAPYLARLSLVEGSAPAVDRFPFNLPFLRGLDVAFTEPVTFFVGENGSGKSTLIEALAELCGLPISGGGRNDLGDSPQARSELAPVLRPSFHRRPRDGYFFRAEMQAQFASLLEARRADPDFLGNPFQRYGGRSLNERSHGEAFLAMLASWMAPGIVLMDEPESALSPQRQLALLVSMARLAGRGDAQFIIATHSPILLTLPGATILSFDVGQLAAVRMEDTSHYRITRGILEAPERYWKHLTQDEGDG